jgi:SAM-dependent methyltransferase
MASAQVADGCRLLSLGQEVAVGCCAADETAEVTATKDKLGVARSLDNHGERLVPGESHDRDEAIRHRSSYVFFKAIIAADFDPLADEAVRILDLGCGVGHGALALADLPRADVVAIDASADAIDYARRYYAAPDITYLATRADTYLEQAAQFDYVVSRHALEHIPDGLQLALRFESTRRRLMVNVPYRESAHDAEEHVTNPHHELNDISENDFAAYPHAEFFYEDLRGVTAATPDGANSIVCVSSSPGLEPVASLVSLPVPAWKPNRLEEIALNSIRERAAIERLKPAYRVLSGTLRAARRGRLLVSSRR